MSRENVEVVRAMLGAVRRRDTATVLALYDPEVEIDFSRGPLAGLLGEQVYRGHEGLRTWSREWYAAWDTIVEDDFEELTDAGEDVVSVARIRARGRATEPMSSGPTSRRYGRSATGGSSG
jgi:hypothetical protein